MGACMMKCTYKHIHVYIMMKKGNNNSTNNNKLYLPKYFNITTMAVNNITVYLIPFTGRKNDNKAGPEQKKTEKTNNRPENKRIFKPKYIRAAAEGARAPAGP